MNVCMNLYMNYKEYAILVHNITSHIFHDEYKPLFSMVIRKDNAETIIY